METGGANLTNFDTFPDDFSFFLDISQQPSILNPETHKELSYN
jgi:hypothetical protein